jgi:biopolymer transport protein ExbD
MNFRKREREASEVETGALADILFFLLMFFLMISTLASPDAIRLLLPKADSTKVTPVVESIRVSVDASNNFFIDGNAQPFALDQVDAQLKEILKTKKANSLIISIDKSRTVQDLTDVYDLAAKNNLSMVMAAEKKK